MSSTNGVITRSSSVKNAEVEHLKMAVQVKVLHISPCNFYTALPTPNTILWPNLTKSIFFDQKPYISSLSVCVCEFTDVYIYIYIYRQV